MIDSGGGCSKLLLGSLLCLSLSSCFSFGLGFRASFSVKNVIPKPERRCVVADEVVVVQVVVLGASPEWNKIV